MTREEIEHLATLKYPSWTTEAAIWYNKGLLEGLRTADANPKSPWISVKDDLPCNHEELINDDSRFGRFTKRVFAYHEDNQLYDDDYMYEFNGEWKWGSCRNTKYWFPIPKLPKE